MKKTGITLCGLYLSLSTLSAQVTENTTPAIPGWNYYGGDEFNGNKIDNTRWGIYGDPKYHYKFDDYGNNKNQGSVQYYRSDMIKVKDGVAYITASREPLLTGRRRDGQNDPAGIDYSVRLQSPFKPKHDFGKYGWWSGALSSRNANEANMAQGVGIDKGTYYPLYSRIEIKAKIPYEFGTWMALWLRHCNGANTFEIDLQEFFVNEDRRDPMKEKGFYLHQTVHGLNYDDKTSDGKPKTTYNNNYREDRIKEIDFDPAQDFHVYGAQIDPEPGDPKNLVVTFLLDGRVRSVFRTKAYMSKDTRHPYKYNALLAENYSIFGEDRVWDVAITGQVGGKAYKKDTVIEPRMYPYKGFGGTLYPELNPKYGGDINKTPKEYVTEIDWLRVYKRASELLWVGSLPDREDYAHRNDRTLSLNIPADKFANLKTGDQLIMDVAALNATENVKLDLFDKYGKAIATLKPEVTPNDAQVTFVVTDELRNKLRNEGCVIKGENVRLFTVNRSSKEKALWSGFKEMHWGETIVPKEQFANIGDGQEIEIVVRDVKPGAKVYLRQNTKIPGESKRPKLSFRELYGHIINLKEGNDESTYTLQLEPNVVRDLKEKGLVITGQGFYLRSVNIIGKSSSNTVTGINKIANTEQNDSTVYSITGAKVRDANEKGQLPRGIYIINGKKVVVK